MSEIKSALELALEKTEGVHGNKEKLLEHDTIQQGKMIASKYLQDPENPENEIGGFLKGVEEKKLSWLKEGIFKTLLSNINLPAEEEDLLKLKVLETGFCTIIKTRQQISQMLGQLNQFFSQYLKNKEELKEHLSTQFTPKLKQKAEELSRKTGSEIILDPSSDPEFLLALKQNTALLNNQYQEALANFKDQLRSLFGPSEL